VHTIPSRWSRLGKCDSNVMSEKMKINIYILLLLLLLSSCVHSRKDPIYDCITTKDENQLARTDPVYGCITTKDGNRLVGDIQWDASNKTYYLQSQSITKSIPLQNVESIQIKQETDIEKAIALFQKKEYQQAIPLLKKAIASDRPFGSSITAIRWLADCYLQLGQPDKVIKLFEKKKWLLEEDSKLRETPDCKRIYNQALNELQKK